jgi:hypothetical protein
MESWYDEPLNVISNTLGSSAGWGRLGDQAANAYKNVTSADFWQEPAEVLKNTWNNAPSGLSNFGALAKSITIDDPMYIPRAMWELRGEHQGIVARNAADAWWYELLLDAIAVVDPTGGANLAAADVAEARGDEFGANVRRAAAAVPILGNFAKWSSLGLRRGRALLGIAEGTGTCWKAPRWAPQISHDFTEFVNAVMNWVCFAPETRLLTPDGDKLICDFKPGDKILSAPEHNPGLPVEVQVVEEVFENVGRLVNLHVKDQIIRTTTNHPFYVLDKGWRTAAELQHGDLFRSHDGQWVPVEEVIDNGEESVVYNLRVSEHHTYFVGSREWDFSVWAHNANQCHHIASDKNIAGGFTAQFKALFSSVGLSLQGAYNKIPNLAGHAGSHPPEYHQWVLDTLRESITGVSKSNQQQYFLNALADLKTTISSNVNITKWSWWR